MTPLLEQVFHNAEVSEHPCTVLWRHRVFVAAANFKISGGMHLISELPRRASHRQNECVQPRTVGFFFFHLSGANLSSACAARRSCVSSLGCFDRARTCGRTGFACEYQERLLTYCDSSCLHRSLRTSSPQCVEPLVWSSTAGSFLITLCVLCLH